MTRRGPPEEGDDGVLYEGEYLLTADEQRALRPFIQRASASDLTFADLQLLIAVPAPSSRKILQLKPTMLGVFMGVPSMLGMFNGSALCNPVPRDARRARKAQRVSGDRAPVECQGLGLKDQRPSIQGLGQSLGCCLDRKGGVPSCSRGCTQMQAAEDMPEEQGGGFCGVGIGVNGSVHMRHHAPSLLLISLICSMPALGFFASVFGGSTPAAAEPKATVEAEPKAAPKSEPKAQAPTVHAVE